MILRCAPLCIQTKTAASQIKEIMEDEPDKGYNGLRISVRTRGCSGNAFHLEYATEKEKLDEEVDAYGTKVWVDSSAIMKVRHPVCVHTGAYAHVYLCRQSTTMLRCCVLFFSFFFACLLQTGFFLC